MTQKKNNNNKKELRFIPPPTQVSFWLFFPGDWLLRRHVFIWFLVTRATPTQGGADGLAGSGLARQVWLMSDVPSSSYILSNI